MSNKLVSLACLATFLLGATVQHFLEIELRAEKQDITFIWNDTEESIPVDGSIIRLQYTDEDTVYIGPADLTDTDCSYIQCDEPIE